MNDNYINRVELQGRVGTVRIQSVEDQLVSTFSLQTEHVFHLRDGAEAVEVAWMNVVAFEGGDVDSHGLTRGSLVHVIGRLRVNRYTAVDGTERIFTEVVAYSLKVLE